MYAYVMEPLKEVRESLSEYADHWLLLSWREGLVLGEVHWDIKGVDNTLLLKLVYGLIFKLNIYISFCLYYSKIH